MSEDILQKGGIGKADKLIKVADLKVAFETVNCIPTEEFKSQSITLRSRHDCAIAVLHLWRYAMVELSVNQVFHMVDGWAQQQDEREECMKLIMTTLVSQYCPHYTFSCVENDEEYQKHLRQHREMVQLSNLIRSEISCDDERESVFGDRPRLRR
jgi:hypothetical protein